MIKHSFAPVTDAQTRVLLLGSLPGELSLAKAHYYGNPLNQFWRLIGAVIEQDLVRLSYEERLQALLAAHVGLWDVVGSATREGSLDAAIRNHDINDLAALAAGLPELRAIGFNGGTSARLGMRKLGVATTFVLLPLPSSSPAYTLPFERKLEQWMKLRPLLIDPDT
jgi:hypoxanthine-DNA glycosylase